MHSLCRSFVALCFVSRPVRVVLFEMFVFFFLDCLRFYHVCMCTLYFTYLTPHKKIKFCMPCVDSACLMRIRIPIIPHPVLVGKDRRNKKEKRGSKMGEVGGHGLRGLPHMAWHP